MLITLGRGYGEAWPGGPWIHSGILPPGLPDGKTLLHFRVAADGRIVALEIQLRGDLLTGTVTVNYRFQQRI